MDESRYDPITAEVAQAIHAFTRRVGGVISCDSTAGTLLTWCSPQGGLAKIVDDRLWAYWPRNGMLGSPIAPTGIQLTPAILRQEVESLIASGKPVNIVIDVPLAWAQANAAELDSWVEIVTHDAAREYIYDAEALATLPGAKYSPKRNLINQFERSHAGWHIEPLAPSPLSCPRLCKFLEEWRLTATDPSGSLGADLKALEIAFDNWGTGIFRGLALIADDQVHGDDALLAFSIFSVPTSEMADTHFEKAVHDIKGASQLINRETARILLADGIKWINREQDMGVPGLRHAKESYHPAEFPRGCALKLLKRDSK